MAAIVIGTTPPIFGIPAAEQGLRTQSLTVVSKSDLKEVADHTGEVTAAAFYNRKNDVTIVGAGIAGTGIDSPGEALTLANAATFTGTLVVGALYVQEVETALKNDDFVMTTIKAVGWDALA